MKRSLLNLSAIALVSLTALAGGCMASEEGAPDSPAEAPDPVASGALTVAFSAGETHYMLTAGDGSLVRLDLSHMKPTLSASGQPVNWRTANGSPVEVFGTKNTDGSINVDELAPPRDMGTTSSALVPTQIGTKRLLAMRVIFDGGPGVGTEQDWKNTLNQVAAHFPASSFGKLKLEYDLVGPFNGRLGSCDDYDRWMNEAKAAAKNTGVDLAKYTNFMVVGNMSCGWAGLGGGNVSWVNNLDFGVSVHELGHDLGVWHSASRTCRQNGALVPLSEDCTIDEYGDPFDPMGHGGRRNYQGNYKAKLGWIPSSNVEMANGDKAYTLLSSSTAQSGLQVLRVKGPRDIIYSVEFRQPTASDQFDPKSSAVNGVLIHAFFTQGDDGGDKAFLLDMNPGGNFEDAALGVGKSYTFFGTSTTISVLSVSPSGAQIKISGATGGDPGGAGNRVVVASSNKCVGVLGAGRNNGDPAVQFPCNGAADQTWAFESVGGSTVVLKDANTGKCMDVLGVSRDNGAKVVQWDCTGGANQKWDVIDAGDGTFALRSVNSGKCLDVSGGNTGDNIPLVQWDCHGGANQHFRKQ